MRNIDVFYDGVVVPGALLLLISGTWLIIEFYGGWDFVKQPWLAGMVFLFASVPTFTHFLDLPMLFLFIALGTIRPETWKLFVAGSILAVMIALILQFGFRGFTRGGREE